VLSANVGANTIGTVVQITDSLNFDSVTNQAMLGGGDGCFGCFPAIGLTGQFREFTGSEIESFTY